MKPASSNNTLSLRGRAMLAAARQFGRAVLGMPAGGAIARPSITDFSPFMWGGRRMTPDQVRVILEGAVAGNIQQQWALFDMMEDTWPRLSKNLNELKRAAARVTLNVQPYAARGEKPTDGAIDRAGTVEAGLRNWRPRTGTLELSLEDTLYNGLDAFGKGLSVLEITWQRSQEGLLPRCSHILHPSRYGWNDAGNELGLVSPTGSEEIVWTPFPAGQFLVGIWHARTGAPGQTALLRSLAPYWVGVTFGWEWLLNNAQIFGVPLRWATYDPNRADLLPAITAMLTNIGSAGWAAFPEGTTMDFKEAVTRATDNPQVLIQTMADKACDLLILGQEASSESKPAGLGSGASDLHGAVRSDRLQDAAQWCADLLNYQLVPALLRLNYGDETEPPTIVPDLAGEPDPAAKALRDQTLSQIAPLPRKWFYERHGIPEPEEGEECVGGPSAMPNFGFPPQGGYDTGALAAPGDESPLATGPDNPEGQKSLKNDDQASGRGETATPPVAARRFNPPRSAVALRAAAMRFRSFGQVVLPGTYEMDAATRRSLAAAHSRDFATLRQAAEPLLTAIEAGNLELVGEIEAFIAKLDKAAPSMIGAGELADVLEAALTAAAIAGAAQSYGKISEKPTATT